jgi:hypothetical protein
MLNKDAYNFNMSLFQCHMQWSLSIVGLSCHIHTMLKKMEGTQDE